MNDPFRQFFLDTIETILQEEPNDESLYKLLRTTSPNLSLDQVNSRSVSDSSSSSSSSTILTSTSSSNNNEKGSERRSKALRTLKSRIHPDKHPHDKRATYLFQNVQIFYDDCCATIELSTSSSSSSSSKSTATTNRGNRKRRQRSDDPLSEQRFPLEFDAMEKWPHMKLHHPKIPSNDRDGTKATTTPTTPTHNVSNTLPSIQAFKCLNGRGALAHGRPITRHFLWTDVEQRRPEFDSVQDVFDSIAKGTRELRSVDQIKEEILTQGPVVSTSFRLTDPYLQQIKNLEAAGNIANGTPDAEMEADSNQALCGGFVKDRVDQEHELLIVGWGITSFGEVWKVLPLWEANTEDIHDNNDTTQHLIPPLTLIGIGQFGIDRLCLAPKISLDHLSWQLGPYFDSDFSDAPKWRDWKEMDLPLTPREFQNLATCFEKGLIHAANSNLCFVIRDQTRLAHSASYRLKEFRWEESTLEWITTVVSVTETNDI
eukprot:CAMPEP_0198256894 /NCGR_PEP_ID=MMETSP1447-20131203/6688_1 /TAXON_ID=420782 /ORGANISM="Chaetoceros dichaeta, Strain CCMP1751" /LENGTH=485 /DNA_ID=CAMNT_0043943645 /DNA_START=45 /DNA_END=1502 /DNA_ORIENTATION=-